MSLLIGVTTCHWREHLAKSQKATWALGAPDVRFFFGGETPLGEGNVGLGCRDDYKGLPEKVQFLCRWALIKGYDRLCKVDDDVYLRPERLLGITGDYVGLLREPPNERVAGYCSGFTYCLSKEAMQLVADAPSPDYIQEDLWVGTVLFKHGITGKHDPRFVLTCGSKRLSPTAFNDVVAAAEFKDMTEPHKRWVDSQREWEETTNILLV